MDTQSLLNEMAEDPAPRPGVDVDRAIAAGRRTIRVRRALAGGAAGLALTAVVGGITYVTHRAAPTAAPAIETTSPPPSRPPLKAPTGFDPQVAYASFGWVPDGMTGRITAARPELFELYATYPLGANEATWDGAYLNVYPKGADTAKYGPDRGKSDSLRRPAPAVNGATAVWMGPDDPHRAVLSWQYADDAWAILSLVNLRGLDDAKAVVHRMAAGVRFGGTERLTVPFEAPDVPAAFKVQSVGAFRTPGDPRPWHARVEYVDPAHRSGSSGPDLVIEVYGSTDRVGDDRKVGRPDTTVDGHPAKVDKDGVVDSVAVFDVNGMHVNVFAYRNVFGQLPAGGSVTIFRSLRLNPAWAG